MRTQRSTPATPPETVNSAKRSAGIGPGGVLDVDVLTHALKTSANANTRHRMSIRDEPVPLLRQHADDVVLMGGRPFGPPQHFL